MGLGEFLKTCGLYPRNAGGMKVLTSGLPIGSFRRAALLRCERSAIVASLGLAARFRHKRQIFSTRSLLSRSHSSACFEPVRSHGATARRYVADLASFAAAALSASSAVLQWRKCSRVVRWHVSGCF